MKSFKFLSWIILIIVLCFFFGCTMETQSEKKDSKSNSISTTSFLKRQGTSFINKSMTANEKLSDAASNNILVTDLTSLTVNDLINKLVGDNVQISNVKYTGANIAAGTFSDTTGIFGFNEGIILSSGASKAITGPNTVENMSTSNGLTGDADLNNLIPGRTTYDACILEFDFIPQYDYVTFDFVFSSEEYNEFVNTSFNDVFGFFLNGTNIALIPDTNLPISINTINGGNPIGTNASYPELYINNAIAGGGQFNTQMDGFTKVITVKGFLKRGVINHIKLAIADTSDSIYDSNVLIRAKSFTSDNPPVVTAAVDRQPNANGWYNSDVNVSFTAVDNDETPVAKIDPALTVSTEGKDQVITGYAIDTIGLKGSASVQINLDKTAPVIIINSPVESSYLPAGTITLDYSLTDNLSGIDSSLSSADLDGKPVTNGQTINLAAIPGTHVLSVTAVDLASNTTTKKITFSVMENAKVRICPDVIRLRHLECKKIWDYDFDCNKKSISSCYESCYKRNGYIRAFIEIQSKTISNLDLSTVVLTVNGIKINALLKPYKSNDFDKDGYANYMVKFDKDLVLDAINNMTGDIVMTVSGKLVNGNAFVGSDSVRVIICNRHHCNERDWDHDEDFDHDCDY